MTAEGFEENFALFYLSRYVLGRALAGPLARAARPVVVNVAGPGAPLDLVHWDGLQLGRAYHGGAALGQGGVLNGLLGTAYAEEYGPSGIRYVLTHPGGGGHRHRLLRRVRRRDGPPHPVHAAQHAKPVEAVLPPVLAAVDAPPAEALSAYVEGRRIPVDAGSFDPGPPGTCGDSPRSCSRAGDASENRVTRPSRV